MKKADQQRICVVGLRGVPGVMGGIESHCEQIFPRLINRAPHYHVTIIGRRPYMHGGPQRFHGLRVVPLPAMKSKYFEAITNTVLGVIYARFSARANIVHIHGIGPSLLSPLARLLGMRVVVTHHGQDFAREKWNRWAKLALRLGEYCALAAADRIIVVSKSVAEELRRLNPRRREKIHYVPNGTTQLPVAADEAGKDVLANLGISPGGYILAVGRLVPEKGFHYLVAAYRKAGISPKLVIVGGADHAGQYSRSLLAEADDNVIFCGYQSHQVLRELYANAGLFVLPSTHEGLPIAALEAISLNAPVLLSDIQPNLDMGLPAQNYFPSTDVPALTERLRANFTLYNVDVKAVARRFDWNTITEETHQIYSELLAA